VIAHRRLQDERRRRFRRPAEAPFPDGPDDSGHEPAGAVATEDEALRTLASERVEDLCARLVPDQRAVVLLRVLGDLTIEQVADVLGKSPGAVKQLQHRAFAALRKLVEREGVSL
jgi:RNA polymerase sigma-70 factor (ECF subfamily)